MSIGYFNLTFKFMITTLSTLEKCVDYLSKDKINSLNTQKINKSIWCFKQELRSYTVCNINNKDIANLISVSIIDLINFRIAITETIRIKKQQKQLFPNQLRDNIITYLQEEFDKLLEYIHQNYLNYLNQNVEAPLYLKERVALATSENLKKMAAKMKRRNISEDLIICVLAPFRELLNSNRHHSFVRLSFLEKLLNKLVELLENTSNSTQNIDLILSKLLIEYNFNRSSFINITINQISEMEENTPLIKEKIAQFEKLLFFIKQTTISCYPGYAPNRIPVRQFLSEFLEDKIDRLYKKGNQHLEFSQQGSQKLEKIRLNMEFSQFSTLFGLLKKQNLFKDRSKDLLEKLSLVFEPKSENDIKVSSLRTAIYNYSPESLEFAKKVIINVLNDINDEERKK